MLDLDLLLIFIMTLPLGISVFISECKRIFSADILIMQVPFTVGE